MTANGDDLAPAPTRAVLYLRVSTGRQAEHDLSIPDQRRQALAYCEGKGWKVVSEYVEPGATATDDRRPEFQRMMDAAANRPPLFHVILVHSFSRFFRDQFQLEFYVRRLAKNGIRLVSITQDLGDDPMSVMMRQIMALFDEYQSKENAKHTLRAMRENARQGYWNGSRPPFGYRIVAAEQRGTRTKKKIDIDPLQAEHVRLMFRLAHVGDGDDGPFGVRQIAHYLNDHGIRTATGGRWGLGMVYEVLTRTSYIGIHRFNVYSWRKKQRKPDDEIVEMAVPAIIDQAEFDEVQEMLHARSPQLKAPRFVSGPTLLGGICFCADCGGAMTLRSSGKAEHYRYYTCCTRNRQGRSGCTGRTVPMAKLDRLVTDHLETTLLAPERVNDLLAALLERRHAHQDRQQERVAALKRQAAEADAKLTRLYAAIEDGVADARDENLKGRLAELRAIRDSARADVERAEGKGRAQPIEITPEALAKFTGEARRKLRTEDGGYRRHIVQAIAQRVDVGDSEVRITGSKVRLLRTLIASGGVAGTVEREVRAFVPNWLPGPDSNQRPTG
ncbi:MAG: recombinase family protein [Alphaproteobacteria bacterium]|nr:recombinase family protein [Alphaproteobacteria bacterium]